MGLISKIEDKLSNSSSSNKLEKDPKDSYDSSSGSASHRQHPISSSDNQGSYGSSGISGGTDVNRDGYGHGQTTSSRMPGSYDTDQTDRTQGNYMRGEDPRTTTNTTTNTTTSHNTYRQPKEPYDPYSRKGQATAAGAATGYPTTSSTQERRSYEDPSVARSNNGGVLNQSRQDPRYASSAQDPRYASSAQDSRYAAGEQESRYPAGAQDPHTAYSNHPSTSQHHYGRDAAIAGGAGAAGVGAYELGKDRHSDPRVQGQNMAGNNPQDISYMNRSSGGDQYEPGIRRAADDPSMGGATGPMAGAGGMHSSTGGSGGMMGGEQSGGLHQAKKSAAAYEAGYKDAMEHMKAEVGQQGH